MSHRLKDTGRVHTEDCEGGCVAALTDDRIIRALCDRAVEERADCSVNLGCASVCRNGTYGAAVYSSENAAAKATVFLKCIIATSFSSIASPLSPACYVFCLKLSAGQALDAHVLLLGHLTNMEGL